VIVLVALGLRFVVCSFIKELMDPAHIQCWKQGNVAAALLFGLIFGNPFDSFYQP